MRLKTRSSAILLAAAVAASTLGTDTYSVMAQEETAKEAVTEEKEVTSEEEVTEEKKEETKDEEKEEAPEEVTADEKEEASDETTDEKTEEVSDVEQENEADVAGVHVPDAEVKDAEVAEEEKTENNEELPDKLFKLLYVDENGNKVGENTCIFSHIDKDGNGAINVTEIPTLEGYDIEGSGDLFSYSDSEVQTIKVKAKSSNVIMKISFVTADGTVIGGGDYFVPAGIQKYSVLDQYAPEGYKIAVSGDFMAVENAEPLQVRVEKIQNEVIMKISFVTADGTVIGGGDYFVPAGIQKYSVLDQYAPEGYKIAVSGDFMAVENAEPLQVRVEKIQKEIIMNISFKDGDEVVAGGDYFVPEGVQNYSVLQKYVPAGYVMTVSGDFMATEGGKLEVSVEKAQKQIVMNIRFMEGETFIAGGDYFVMEGVQNYSVLEQYVPEGYRMTVSGDFYAEEGGKLDVNVEKINKEIIMNISFKDGDEVVAGGDYFVPEGVQNYSVLQKYVPEGYVMTVSGDFMAVEGTHLDVNVEKAEKQVIMNIRFMDGETFVAGGDYFVMEGVQNYSVLEQYVPEGYKMAVSGDFYAEEGGKLDVRVEKIQKDIIMNISFIVRNDDGSETVVAGGDYFVPEGIQNYSVLEQYVPEGYVMVVGGDFFAEAGTHLDVFIEKVAENPDPNPGDEGTDDTDDGDEGTTGGGTTTTGGTAATAAVLGARVDAPAAPEAGVLGERVEQPAAEAGVLGERKSADTADNTPVGVWTALAGTAVAALAAFGLKRKKEEK